LTVVNKEINVRIKSFKIDERVISDHLSLEMKIEEKKEKG